MCCWAKQHDSRGSPTGTQHLLAVTRRTLHLYHQLQSKLSQQLSCGKKQSPLSRVKLWGHQNSDHHSSDARRPYRPCHRLGISPRVSGHSLAARCGVSGDLGLRNHRDVWARAAQHTLARRVDPTAQAVTALGSRGLLASLRGVGCTKRQKPVLQSLRDFLGSRSVPGQTAPRYSCAATRHSVLVSWRERLRVVATMCCTFG